MSLRFSRVKAMTGNKASIFLVGGVPHSQADLDSWTAFRTFTEDLKDNEQITVCVETFVYGEEDPNDATPEEIAYFYMRIEKRPDFIEARTEKIGESEFFIWLDKKEQ